MESATEKVLSESEKEAIRLHDHYTYVLNKIKKLVKDGNITDAERIYNSVRISLKRYCLYRDRGDDIVKSFLH